MKLRKLEILKRKKKGVEYKIVFEEKEDGLYVTDTEKEIEEKIGNFFLNLVREDINYTDEKNNLKTRYLFSIFYIHPKSKKLIKASTQFYYIKGEQITQKLENRLPRQAILDFTNKQSLEHFKIYIRELIKRGVKDNMHLLANNEEVAERVKNYIISFLDLINGKENQYIEYSYYYNMLSYNPIYKFYNNYGISSNETLFLFSYRYPEIYFNWFKMHYEKIGFIENPTNKPAYIYIHLPSLKRLMEKEQHKEMTTQMLNIGLRKLGLIALDEGKNTINLKKSDEDNYISMNLTRLHFGKLKELYRTTKENLTHEIFSNLNKLYITKDESNPDTPSKNSSTVIAGRPAEENTQEISNDEENYIAFISDAGVVIYNESTNEIIQRIPNFSSRTTQELSNEYQGLGCITKVADTEEERISIKNELNKYYQEHRIYFL